MRSIITLLCCVAALGTLGAADTAAPLTDSQRVYETKVKPFLQAHCVKCHNDKDTRAGFRIDTLGTDFQAGKTADHWKEIYDNIGVGKMPPKKEPRPDAREASLVTDWIIQELRAAEKRAKSSSGRIPMRRLNRTEYANTLRDLFYLDDRFARVLEEDLPMDGVVDGFDRGGAALFIDESQLTRYLETAERVVNEVLFAPEPKKIHEKCLARQIRWYNRYEGKSIDLGLSHNSDPKGTAESIKIDFGPNYASLKNGGLEYIASVPTNPPFVGLIGLRQAVWYPGPKDPIRPGQFQDGWYRVKIRAGAFRGTGARAVDDVKVWFRYALDTPYEAKASVVIDTPLDQPKDYEMMVFLRTGPPDLDRTYRIGWIGATDVVINNPILDRLDTKEYHENFYRLYFAVQKKRPQAEIDDAKKKLEDFYAYYRKTRREEVKVLHVINPKIDLQTVPRLWIESLEIEGPVLTWPPKGRTELFLAEAERPIDKAYIREIFTRFLPRAYRRPVAPKEIDEIVAWVLKAQEANRLSGREAVAKGVRAVLCSPRFLYIQEPAGKVQKVRPLNDHELAVRLSYFLWSTMPDTELSKLAADNKLHEPKTLETQVQRMLKDPKGSALVQNFAGQWLKVRDFSSVNTDRQQYRAYDDELRDSSYREPYEFFKEVLEKDLSILNFVDSNFLVIDERLAKHYGIPGIKGSAFRKVAIGPEHHRGGVLGMAGVLTYLTDGLRTLPVRRAAYVLDTFWNAPPPPPPPNAGNLPPIKGKNLTVRQRLDQHRGSDICASCHARIDPFGVALENYDAIGAWRERENAWPFRGDAQSPSLDISGVLPNGRQFKTLAEYKHALLAEKDRFVRSFVEKMLGYALGRSIGVTDQETVAAIIKTLEKEQGNDYDKYRLQSLVQAIVASEVFQTK
jgi:hypothetical protein